MKANAAPNSPDFGRIWPGTLGRFRPRLSLGGQSWPGIDQMLPNLDRRGPMLNLRPVLDILCLELGLDSTKLGSTPTKFEPPGTAGRAEYWNGDWPTQRRNRQHTHTHIAHTT